MTELLDVVRAEIEARHVFFEEWFGGTADEAELEPRFLRHLAPGFAIVSPRGDLTEREALATAFRASRGARPGLRIAIEDVTLRADGEGWVLATYVERQWGGGDEEAARLSTVLLAKGEPILWLHVHETWMPQPQG